MKKAIFFISILFITNIYSNEVDKLNYNSFIWSIINFSLVVYLLKHFLKKKLVDYYYSLSENIRSHITVNNEIHNEQTLRKNDLNRKIADRKLIIGPIEKYYKEKIEQFDKRIADIIIRDKASIERNFYDIHQLEKRKLYEKYKNRIINRIEKNVYVKMRASEDLRLKVINNLITKIS